MASCPFHQAIVVLTLLGVGVLLPGCGDNRAWGDVACYAVHALNSNGCPDYTVDVNDFIECRLAAEALGRSSAGRVNWHNSPRGCFSREGAWGLYWNEAGTGSSHPERAPVCKQEMFLEGLSNQVCYARGDWDSTRCEPGFDAITRKDHCITAARVLQSKWRNDGGWSNLPEGCLDSRAVPEGVFFNAHEGHSDPDRAPICRKASSMMTSSQSGGHNPPDVNVSHGFVYDIAPADEIQQPAKDPDFFA